MPDIIYGICIVLCIALMISFFIYSVITNKIISDQKSEIHQLQIALNKANKREPIPIVSDGRHPKFGNF